MAQQELLTYVVAALQGLGIEFMLSGSHASSLQGEARTTHDIDLVVRLGVEDVRSMLDAFSGDRFYLSEAAVVEAVRSQRMFNLLETATGEKVDFWVLTDSPFDRSRFSRRQRIDFGNQQLEVSAPEDTILMKLLWCKQSGGSEKQFGDVLRVFELQSDVLDQGYLRQWVQELQVEDLWQRVLTEAEPLLPPEDAGT
jgi:hypothetical protein